VRGDPHAGAARRKLPKGLRIALAIGLLLVGGLFGFVPFVPGWPLGLAGLVILAEYFPAARSVLNWARRKAGLDPAPPSGEAGRGGKSNHGSTQAFRS